jgi:hypothetical protein
MAQEARAMAFPQKVELMWLAWAGAGMEVPELLFQRRSPRPVLDRPQPRHVSAPSLGGDGTEATGVVRHARSYSRASANNVTLVSPSGKPAARRLHLPACSTSGTMSAETFMV